MTLNDLTIGEARQLAGLFSGGQTPTDNSHWKVGQNYFIRTVTHHYTGKLEKVTREELVLSDAAWIADDGRFYDALKTGELKEIEPFPKGEVIIGRGAIVDASIWNHALPLQQK